MNTYGVRPLFIFSGDADLPGVCNLSKVVDRSAINPSDRGATHDSPACNLRGLENLFLDANLDEILSPLDTLLVINTLNAASIADSTGQADAEGADNDAVAIALLTALDLPVRRAFSTATQSSSPTGTASFAAQPVVRTVASDRDHLLTAIALDIEATDPESADLLDILVLDFGRPK